MIRPPASEFRCANLLTYAGVSAAALGIAFTKGPETRFWAGAGIALAVACDLFDGRFARLFTRTDEEKKFGVEIDSLADVISFGLAPAVCLFRAAPAAPAAMQAMLLAAGTFYLLCIMTRLAHFNIFQAGTGGFIGLPSNLPALFFAVVLFWSPSPLLMSALLVIAGGATVAGFPIPRPNRVVLYTLLAICIVVAGLHVFCLAAG
jgi:CDP-diacylglycerol--serine O-phosphatidyltransferase